MPTAAMQALYEGDAARAGDLLGPDEELTTPEAAAFGRLGRLQELLERNPAEANAWSDDGFSALALAIFGEQEATARLLIEHGADLEAPSRHETIRGVRPLHTAAFVGSAQLVQVLLEAGADVNGRDEQGSTALHTAAENGDVELARALLANGADPSLSNETGKRPTDLAKGGVAKLLS